MWGRGLAVAAALLLAGCGAGDANVLDSPIDLYHDLQGGTIASQRPPPPGVGQPYPDLGSVPGRPTPTTAGERRAIYAALAAERERVTRQNGRDPLALRPQDIPPSPSAAPPPPPSQPAAAPQPGPAPAAGSPAAGAPATDDNAPSVAVLQAADAPPAKRDRTAARPPPAPPGPLPELEARVADGGPVPAIPDRPPAPPALEGVALPPGPPGSVNVYFRRDSAVVPLDADAALRQLAAERRDRAIDVRAPGDNAGRGPDAEARGLPLGLRRAQAIAAVLAEAGVPAAALRVVAQGAGQAGVARVVGSN